MHRRFEMGEPGVYSSAALDVLSEINDIRRRHLIAPQKRSLTKTKPSRAANPSCARTDKICTAVMPERTSLSPSEWTIAPRAIIPARRPAKSFLRVPVH